MCIYKECPIFDKCDKEIDQVLYCRHVEMMKKLAKLRADMKRQHGAAQTLRMAGDPKNNVVSIHSGRSERTPQEERTTDSERPVIGLPHTIN